LDAEELVELLAIEQTRLQAQLLEIGF